MSAPINIYWGDTHHNTYMGYRQEPPLAEVVDYAASYLDFYTGAYYTPLHRHVALKPECRPASKQSADGHPGERFDVGEWKGVALEGLKDPVRMAAEWEEFQAVSAARNRPGEFVMFPGYEWQGNGRWGDHNVIHLREGHPICTASDLADLYAFLRGKDALAIPHHTGYRVGLRAPVWSACDERLSPFSEIYSIHGCSETDEEWVGLRTNTHMGPGFSGGTYQDALDRGMHLGAICSTDNWVNMPGQWNQGLAACLAHDLSRDSLWEAFRARRVYGVTGDRILLDFSVNGQVMGSILNPAARRDIDVRVRGTDAVDRIEILRNGRVMATHCHQGTWEVPRPGQRSRFKMRVEVGWGSRPGEIPLPDQEWDGTIALDDGTFTGWSPCWIARGQGVPVLAGPEARFHMRTCQKHERYTRYSANVFEFESDPAADLQLELNGLSLRDSVGALARTNRLLWYKDDCKQRVEELTGVTPGMPERDDIYYHHSWKAKVHKVIPESGYTACFSITDDEPLSAETNYRVRVEQRNGQRAWSSPIWVKAEA